MLMGLPAVGTPFATALCAHSRRFTVCEGRANCGRWSAGDGRGDRVMDGEDHGGAAGVGAERWGENAGL